MTRVLVWKEVREQWVIWLVLALAAAGAVAGVFGLISPGSSRDGLLTGVLWLTAWGYGLICGALLLAGETEGATQDFLDTLPATRQRVWNAKATTGLALLIAQLAALSLIGFVLFRERYARQQAAVDLAGMLLCGGIGYAWGLYSGSSSVHVLGALARAAVLQLAAAAGVYLCVTVVLLFYPSSLPYAQHGSLLLEGMGLVAAGVALRSRSLYCYPDRLRADSLRPDRGRRIGVRWAKEFRQAWWEARWFALAMGLYGVAGMVALVFLGLAAWPLLTLVLGVACGITAFSGGPGRRARAAVRFTIGVAAAALVTMPVTGPILLNGSLNTTGLRIAFQNNIPLSAFSALGTNPGLFLSYWLVEGFASGLLAACVFRRRLAAAPGGLILSALFAAAWLPTVISGGGLYYWHLAAVPAVFLAAALWLERGRAARLTAYRVVVVSGGAILVAALWTAAALYYRAYEIPPAPDALDVEAFKASIPLPADNEGARLTASGLIRLAEFERNFVGEQPEPTADGRRRPNPVQFGEHIQDAYKVINRGRQDVDPLLARFLDRVFANPWAEDLARAADHPLGTLVDPRDTTFRTALPPLQTARTADILLVVRGMQLQDSGDPQAFADNLRTSLALARIMRHRAGQVGLFLGAGVEGTSALGVERWLERLDGRPDLLRQTLDTLQEHLKSPQTDLDRLRWSEFVIRINSFADPDNIPLPGNGADPFFRLGLNDKPLLRFAWTAPWEKIRTRRALEALESDESDLCETAEKIAPPLVLSLTPSRRFTLRRRGEWPRPDYLYPVRVAALQMALRLYQEEVGRPAEKLDELVPKYLPAVPLDPYDGQPFRYRLSRGEALDWPPEGYHLEYASAAEPRKVPAGQGILWSVGKDKKDDGGHVQELWHPSTVTRDNEDRIALVPLPPRRP